MAEVVVITGASSGIGRATAILFGKHGAKVALLARGIERLDATRREVEAAGGQAMVIPTDVADPEAVEAAAASVERHFGPIDVWINNAAVSMWAPVVETKPEEYRRIMEVGYLGQVHGTLAALKRMRPRNAGTIVLVGSGLAHRSFPLQSAYCAMKHAVNGFAESLRSELEHEKSQVHVTMVQPSAINTPLYSWARTTLPNPPKPPPPVYQPEVVAKAIFFAAHNRRREVPVGAPSAGGLISNALFPKALDKVLGRFGYGPQLAEERSSVGREDNLKTPVPEDRGIHGDYDRQARGYSVQLWTTTHRKATALGLIALAGGAVYATILRRKR
jgi:NAD(P)-dependent dehydrogenase (short-subunit alcohol dehydrogenase family)